MRLNGKSKIVSDDDIIMSDGSTSLSDRLSSIANDVNSLKSNVKWIYKYGGVGSGSGSGTGTKAFSIYATLNSKQLKDGQNVILNGAGTYPLLVKINNPSGSEFLVTYTYYRKTSSGGTSEQSKSQKLNIDNAYNFSVNIDLNVNSSITIEATNGEDTQQITCNYIVQPYQFDLSLVNDSNKQYITDDGSYEIFTETARETGLNVKVDYDIQISVTSAEFSVYFGNREIKTCDITDASGTVLVPIDQSYLTDEKSGIYALQFKTKVIPEGGEITVTSKNISIALIPQNLYCLITPDTGAMYSAKQSDEYYKYDPGYITYSYKIYEGTNRSRTYSVFIYHNDEQVSNLSVTERQLNQVKILANTSGWNKLTIKVSNYSKDYYFYVNESQQSLDWFDSDESDNWEKYYYRITECTKPFTSYKNKTYIQQTANSDVLKFTGLEPPELTGVSKLNTHIAIGLQYSYINNDEDTVLSIFDDSDSPTIAIGQKESTKSGSSVTCYIQKETDPNCDAQNKYHLLQIFSKYVKSIGNETYYDVSMYIDGRLEASFPDLSNTALFARQIQINGVNVYINTIEVDYKQVTDATDNTDYTVYNYYLKYQASIIANTTYTSEELQVAKYLKNITVGLNGRVTVADSATINNIAKNIQTPVLLMTTQDVDSSGSSLIEKIEKDYGEDGTVAGGDLNFNVQLQWSSGGNELSEVTASDRFPGAQFRAALQGSSTKLYRVKNFTLAIENTDAAENADVYLYSPNFNSSDTDTFLPETQFTLKADVVDSSHSNNTSCGKFINTVCEKFSDSISDSSALKPYIKNCLEGFPILLFLCINTTDPESGDDVPTYYYLGVYNFNLGREAYYNLGYKDLSVFGNNTLVGDGKNFVFHKVSSNDDGMRDGVGVAEIQGNSNYFDFSQYDSTILFQQNDGDNTYMFGDLVHGDKVSEKSLQNQIQKLVKGITLGGGYLFDYIKKNKGSYEDGYNAAAEDGSSKNQVPNYNNQYRRKQNGAEYKYVVDNQISNGTNTDLINLCTQDVDANRPAMLNYKSISEYYTICMVLGLVDSVMKNLNIKTWTGTNDTATWFAAFYDMDTCLGINNSGGSINYFAFSDYWDSQITKTENEIDYPTVVKIYRDFCPNNIQGYDVPSSYLFAVAKYARLVLQDYSDTEDYPQQLYALWRSNTINNKTHEGILRNVDAFIDNFYSNNLGSVNNLLVTYNYRSKYLSLGSDEKSTTWIETDYKKFNGTRINQVRDWLSGRLHILDAYFNLNALIQNPIQYRTESGEWDSLMVGDSYVYDARPTNYYSVSSNEDVTILRDIFSSGSSTAGLQLNGNFTLQIKCPEYSPLQITSANNIIANYILGGNNYQYFTVPVTGNQQIKLGGSQAWTYMQSINWAATGSSLSITSDKLEFISGTSGTITGISLNTPSVKTITLTSGNYSGTLSLDGIQNYPNLTSVNISGSRLSLDINNLDITSVNINNTKSNQASVQIANCTKIKNFYHNNTTLGSLVWLNISGSLKNVTFSNTNITSYTLTCVEKGGSFTLTNDASVESVTLTGFETVTIRNCQKLKKIVIQSYTDHVNTNIYTTSLSVSDCKNDQLCISSDSNTTTANTVYLTNSTNLKYIYFRGCTYLKYVYLPKDLVAKPYCFEGITQLETIDTDGLYISDNAFCNCSAFEGKNSSGKFANLKVDGKTTSLQSAFYNTNVNFDFVCNFYKTAILKDNSITNVVNMFNSCPSIIFGLDEYKEYVTDGEFESPLDQSVLNKVTNASGLYSWTKMTVNFKDLYNFGSSNGCNYNSIINPDNAYFTLDFLESCINKITYWGCSRSSGVCYQIPINEDGTIIDSSETISFKDIWNINDQAPKKLSTIHNFNINSNYLVDLQDAFNENWTSLTTLNLCFWDCYSINLGKLLYNLPNLTYLVNCFNQNSKSTDDIDLWEFVNWEKFVPHNNNQEYGCFSTSGYWYNSGSFNFKRHISADNYKKICNLFIKNNKYNLSNLFYNTTINNYSGELTFGDSGIDANAYYMRHTYDGAYISDDGIALSDDFFSSMPNVQDVRYCFANTKLSKPLPFNFFKKRYDAGGNTAAFVKVGDVYKEATLHEYKYRQHIWNYSYLFYNTEFTDDARQYTPGNYTIKDNCAINNDTTDSTVYTEYYTRTIDEETQEYKYTKHKISTCTEISDAEDLTGGWEQSVNVGFIQTNPNIGTCDKNKLIIPPDFFYGTATSHTQDSGDNGVTSYSYAFACKPNNMIGIIPKNIFSANRAGTVQKVFDRQIVIPMLVKTIKGSNSIDNVYVQYPKNYTANTSLSYAFTSYPIVLRHSVEGDITTTNYSFILLNESISKQTSSLDHAFYFDVSNFVMYSTSVNSYNNNYEFNICGSYSDSGITHGFDMTRFSDLKLDNMLFTPVLTVLNGNLFNDAYDISKCKLSSSNSRIVNCYNSSAGNKVSGNIIWPKASSSIVGLFNSTVNIDIRKDNIVDSDTSEKYYKATGVTIV